MVNESDFYEKLEIFVFYENIENHVRSVFDRTQKPSKIINLITFRGSEDYPISSGHIFWEKRKNAEKVIKNAVKGMLPHNKLGRKLLKHLKVYSGSTHPHEAQNPKELKIN